MLVGIVSEGTAQSNPRCAVTGQYGVYSNVVANRAWVDNVLAGLLNPTDAMSMIAPSVFVVLGAIALALSF